MSDKKKDPYDINLIFEAMTIALIESLKRNSLRHKADELEEGFRWEMWQSVKLRAMNAYRKCNRQIVTAAMKEAEELVDVVLKDSFSVGEKRHESLWGKFVNLILKPFRRKLIRVEGEIDFPQDFKKTVLLQSELADIVKGKPSMKYEELLTAPPEHQFFGMNDKKLEALQKSVKNDLKKAQHGVLRKMDDVYRQTIYRAEVNMTAGAKTLNQAIDMATKEFLEKGINTIEYSNGRRVTVSAYAEMALRTASQRATFLGEGKKRDEWGVYTVVMSAHANCSPMCLPYQGTVMIDDVFTAITKEDAAKLSKETGYILLSEAMKNHAFHPHCRHTLATFFPGVSSLPVIPDEKEATKNYNAEQRQRYMERQIRKYKRLEAGSVDEQNQAKYGSKVKEWQDRLKQHLAENPQLRRDRQREKITGFPPIETKPEVKTYERYKERLGGDISDQATFEQLKKSEDWPLVQLDYRRRGRLISNPDLALPNGTQATAADAKFSKYLFNPDNKTGFAKGAAFTSRLGYNADNWPELQQEILKRSDLYPALRKGSNDYGELYEQKLIMYGKHGKPTNVIVGWLKDGKSTKMTSTYIKEVKGDGD